MIKLLKPALFAAPMLLSACWSNDTIESKHVTDTEIFHVLSINEQAGTTASARAVYRVGGPTGTTVLLSEPGQIKVNGVRLGYSSMLFGGAQYTGEIPPAGNGYTFILTEYSGRQRNWRIPRIAVAPQYDTLRISLSRGGNIPLFASEAKRNEEVDIIISQHDTSTSLSSGTRLVQLRAADLAAFRPGKARIQFSRSLSGKVSYKDHIGGSWHCNYTSSGYPLTFVP